MLRKGIIPFAFVVVLLFLLFLRQSIKPDARVTSPLPPFLSILSNKEVSTTDIWLPEVQSLNIFESNTPVISAKSALVYDITSSKTLFAKNEKQKLPIASLTKVMTAIIGMENKKNGNSYKVYQDDLVGEDSMGLSAGEVLSLNDLLYGLILHSGNDAAETIATNFPAGRMAFIASMNNKAKSFGLSDTNFTNPTGLEGDGVQYSTAYDLLVIARHSLLFPQLVQIFKTFDYNIPYSSNHKFYSLENETNLITSYPGVEGIKTGYTPEAGLCLITYLNYQGHQIIAVLLGSENRRQEMKDLLDYSLNKEGINPPKHQ